MWSKQKIQNHEAACVLLGIIKDLAFEYIKNNPNTTEIKIQHFILDEFKKNNITTGKEHPDLIIAFNKSASSPHYNPKDKPKRLSPNSLILIDIWAHLKQKNSPQGDITWMGYYGNKIPDEIIEVWNIVKDARDFSIKFIVEEIKRGNFPTGKEIDDIAIKVISDTGFKENILHTTGHAIGFDSPHGAEPGISQKNLKPIIKNLAYTIEPGIYLKDKLGVRSEIDFYINDNNELIITTPIQKELIHILPK
jgi:Xaa-Pro aminopeptidase